MSRITVGPRATTDDGGGGVKLRVPRDIFVGRNRGAAEAARDAGLDADDLAEFTADPDLLIILRVGNVDTFQAYRSSAWRDVTNVAEGVPGPPPSDAQVQNAVQAGVKPYARIGGAAIAAGDLAADAVTSEKIANGAITDRKLAADSVSEAKLKDNAVTADKIARDAVGSHQIASNAVTRDEIAANAVGTAEIGNDQITEAKLDAAARQKLNASGSSSSSSGGPAVDQTARDAANAAQNRADAAYAQGQAGLQLAQANLAKLDRFAVFGQYELNPGGISGAEPPDFIALTLSTKRTPKIISQIRVNLGGVVVADLNRIARPVSPVVDPLAEFNQGPNTYELSGGVINCTFASASDKRTFSNAVAGTVQRRPQFIHVEIQYTFTDGTNKTDRAHFGVNNNAFDLARNPEFSSDVQTLVGSTPGPSLIVSNISSYDAAQNRFEDSSGNEVVVPNNSIVTLADAVYKAAVADADFTPNPRAIFITR